MTDQILRSRKLGGEAALPCDPSGFTLTEFLIAALVLLIASAALSALIAKSLGYDTGKSLSRVS